VLFCCYLFTEGIFSWIFIRNSLVIEGYQKLLGIFIYAFMLYRFQRLKRGERILLVLFSLVILRLVMESLLKYNVPFKQLTMFTVLFPVVFVLFVKYILRTMELDLLEFMAKFYLITYVVFMLLFGRGFSFSLDGVEMNDYGPFSGDSRIIHASHIFMMIIPLLWFLHRYMDNRKLKFLLPFLFCVVIILVHQHRSVWSSALVAIFFYFFATIRNRFQKLSRIANLALGALALLVVSYFLISNLFPGFIDFLSDRFSEIFDPSKEGSTGNFRIEQREVYFNLFLQRPVFGWTFEGFEMPNPLVDWWPDMTGQHFHEGYIEMLFYHGVVGLLLKYGFLLYLLVKVVSKKLSPEAIMLIAFSISGLVFSFSYVLPLVFWGHVGMCLYYLERDRAPEEPVEEEAEEPEHTWTLSKPMI
jgi:O-antigen ligase